MNPTIEITSLAVNKLKNSHDDFIKYNIDVSLDEIENSESGIKLKYKFVLLSNPTNTKLTIEGVASLFGNEADVSKQLEPDQKNIPVVVNGIYQEVFPLIYIVSKSLQIPCPAYKLSQISSVAPQEAKAEEALAQEPAAQGVDNEPIEQAKTEEIKIEETESPPPEPASEPVIQEANVSSI
ncbi:MAG: hypothetical protein ACREBI_04470 [Nitrosotalea sp.]